MSYKSAYIDVSNKPAYAFGYGLSYTSFSMSNLQLSKKNLKIDETLKVTFTITNTGKYSGEEVVQLYIHDLVASVARPVKELKDFQKVKLSPNESKTLTFEIDKEKLSFYNEAMHWGTEPGEFKLMIGNSSDNILLETNFALNN